jgi:chemotaxis signal transduction protein/LysM repeat protein
VQGQGHHNKLLLFQVGPVKCSVFSNDILTIIPPPKQETAGRTGRLPGIFRHNNRIVRVVDMRTKFGLSPSSPEHGRLILAEIPKGIVAFWVDQIINVIDQEEGRWDILPATLPRDVFTRTFVLDEELILHTECARMEAMSPSAALTEHIEQLQEQEKARRAKRAAPTRPVAPEAKQTAAPETETATTAPMTARPHTAPTEPIKSAPPKAAEEKAPLTPPPREDKPQAPKPASTPSPARPGVAPRPETTSTATGALGQGPQAAARPTPRPETKPAAPIQARPSAPRPETPTPSRPTEPRKPYTPPRPSPATVSPPPQTREWETEEKGGGLGWLMLLLLLIFLGGSGVLLYFTGFFGPQADTTPPLAQVEEPVWQPPVLIEPEPETHEPPPLAEAEPAPAEPEQPLAEAGPVPAEPEEALAEPEPAPVAPTSGEAAEEPPYSASIEKDEQGITITLEGPIEQPQDSLLKGEEAPAAEAEAGPTPAEAAQPEPEQPEPAPVAEAPPAIAEPEPLPEPQPEPVKPKPAPKKKRVITHVVVKGDTLWDIAERYVKDPYRYPELARLSGIKNPDLIYPGDIVRIIEK